MSTTLTNDEWILCELTTRWAAALRTHFRRALFPTSPPRILEARRLRDVTERLSTRPACMVLLEVNRGNLSSVLTWLADATPRFPATRFAALLDRNLADTPQEREDTVAALFEAGVCEVAHSPRRFSPIVAVTAHGCQYPETASSSGISPTNVPLREWAWSRLPWQADQRRIG
jgi:hypothetical protein